MPRSQVPCNSNSLSLSFRWQQKSSKKSYSGYKLFSKGKEPLDVAIQLNLRQKEVWCLARLFWLASYLEKNPRFIFALLHVHMRFINRVYKTWISYWVTFKRVQNNPPLLALYRIYWVLLDVSSWVAWDLCAGGVPYSLVLHRSLMVHSIPGKITDAFNHLSSFNISTIW